MHGPGSHRAPGHQIRYPDSLDPCHLRQPLRRLRLPSLSRVPDASKSGQKVKGTVCLSPARRPQGFIFLPCLKRTAESPLPPAPTLQTLGVWIFFPHLFKLLFWETIFL